MEYRQLGGSGLKVSALSFGTSTFGGIGALFKAWGCTDVEEARRMIGGGCRQSRNRYMKLSPIHQVSLLAK